MPIAPSVLPLFRAAGWTPGRRVEVPPAVPRTHPAFDLLAEFGGLRIGQTGKGENHAKSDLNIHHFDESDAVIAEWEAELSTVLIGIGTQHHEHGALCLSSSGKVFHCSLVHALFDLEGQTFDEAAERLLLGRRGAIPMLLPREQSVWAYGVELHRGDSRVMVAPYVAAR